MKEPTMSERVDVRKTYKLFIGGAFPRSESGRTYEVRDAAGAFWANAAWASRKDARDAVIAARKGTQIWSQATAYNRGQVMYRVAEVMEGRRDQLVSEIRGSEGAGKRAASQIVDQSIDRVVWYAGWADKYAQVLGNTNPVAGPYFNFSLPEPTGVVAAIAPAESSLLGLVNVVFASVVTGNSIVVIASTPRPIPAITLAEILATSDVPAGVVNILTGEPDHIAPWLATHADVNALDLTGASDPELATRLQIDAAGTVKRVRPPQPGRDWAADPGLRHLRTFIEIKTVWHPQGV
jgi:acyl-CoA reductase-like NAD-dependent aldehyde dehydrogenase